MPISPPTTHSKSPSVEEKEEGSEECAMPICLDGSRLLGSYVRISGSAKLRRGFLRPVGKKEKGGEVRTKKVQRTGNAWE